MTFLNFHHLFFHLSGIGSCGASYSITFCPNSLLSQMSIVMSYWSVSGSDFWHTINKYLTLTKTSLRYPTVALSHGDPKVVLPVLSFAPAGHRWDGALMTNSKHWIWAWVVAELVGQASARSTPQARDRACSPKWGTCSLMRGRASWLRNSIMGLVLLFRAGPALPGLMSGGTRSPKASKGWSWLNNSLRF